MDVQQQMEYWLNGSQDDMEAAAVLLDKRKIRQSLFLPTWRLRKR